MADSLIHWKPRLEGEIWALPGGEWRGYSGRQAHRTSAAHPIRDDQLCCRLEDGGVKVVETDSPLVIQFHYCENL